MNERIHIACRDKDGQRYSLETDVCHCTNIFAAFAAVDRGSDRPHTITTSRLLSGVESTVREELSLERNSQQRRAVTREKKRKEAISRE